MKTRAAICLLLLAGPARAEPEVFEGRFVALSDVDWVIHRESSEDEVDPATGAPLNQDRFVVRRARAGYVVESQHSLARGELEVQGVSELGWSPYELSMSARARLDLDPDPESKNPERQMEGRLTLGLFSIPFGYDVVELVQERPWLERTTFARALFPGQRDLGVGFFYRFSALRLAVAWMNGEPIGEQRFAGIDATASKDVVGRVGFEARAGRLAMAAGVSGLSGEGLHPGTAATKDRLAWSDGNEDGLVDLTELSVIPGAPATASQLFPRFAIGADARIAFDIPVLGALELRAEIVRAKNLDRGVELADPVSRGRDLRELGWYLGASQEITRYAEIAVRYDVYDPDSDSRRQWAANVVPYDARYRTLSFAASGRVEHFRLMLEYDLRENPLGLLPSGETITLADDALTLRGEFSY